MTINLIMMMMTITISILKIIMTIINIIINMTIVITLLLQSMLPQNTKHLTEQICGKRQVVIMGNTSITESKLSQDLKNGRVISNYKRTYLSYSLKYICINQCEYVLRAWE